MNKLSDITLDLDRIPDIVYDIMDKFDSIEKGVCMLAGGAVRDLIFGGPIKDWDFFLDTRRVGIKTPRHHQFITFLKDMGFVVTSKERDHPYEEHRGIDAITTFGLGSFLPIQLILAPWRSYPGEEALLETFDMSTCQAGLTMDGRLITTKSFMVSCETRCHTVYMKNYTSPMHLASGLYGHVPRVVKKYPWPVLIDFSGVGPSLSGHMLSPSYLMPF